MSGGLCYIRLQERSKNRMYAYSPLNSHSSVLSTFRGIVIDVSFELVRGHPFVHGCTMHGQSFTKLLLDRSTGSLE